MTFISKDIASALLVSFMWGLVPIIQKNLVNRMNKITLFIIDSFIYFLCVSIVFLFHHESVKTDIFNLSFSDILILTLSTIVFGVSADLLYLHVLKEHQNPFVLPIIYCGPVVTLLISYLFMKERLTNFYGILGVFLIIGGIICISFYE